jgi:hypothetical protein
MGDEELGYDGNFNQNNYQLTADQSLSEIHSHQKLKDNS